MGKIIREIYDNIELDTSFGFRVCKVTLNPVEDSSIFGYSHRDQFQYHGEVKTAMFIFNEIKKHCRRTFVNCNWGYSNIERSWNNGRYSPSCYFAFLEEDDMTMFTLQSDMKVTFYPMWYQSTKFTLHIYKDVEDE